MRDFISSNGIIIHVGQNENENDHMVRTFNRQWLWIHLEKIPSPHVVIESSDPDSATLKEAFLLCKFYSKAKTATSINAISTKIHNLTPVKNKPGMVTFSKFTKRTINNHNNYSILNNIQQIEK